MMHYTMPMTRSSLCILATLLAARCANASADGPADCAAHRQVLNSIRRRLPDYPENSVELKLYLSVDDLTRNTFEVALKNVLETFKSLTVTDWPKIQNDWKHPNHWA